VTFLDFILLAVIVGFLVKGLSGGFARVGVGFIATVVGIFCAFWSYGTPAAWIMPYVNSRPVANLLGTFWEVSSAGRACPGSTGLAARHSVWYRVW
jgi:uncharacterized membrane protein required for colicin V production